MLTKARAAFRKIDHRARPYRARWQMTRALARHHPLGRDIGWQFEPVGTAGPGHPSRHVFLCTPPGGATPLVAKVFARPELAERQFAALEEARQKTPLVAAPLFVDTRTGVIGVEHIAGPTLASLLGTPEHDSALEAAGRWLRAYHDATALTGEAASASDGLDQMMAGDGARPAALGDLCARLSARQQALAPGGLVLGFGPLDPGDIILSEDGPRGIDRRHPGPGRPEADLARLLFSLSLFRARRAENDLIDEDHAILLGGYGTPGADPAALSLALDRNAVHLWARGQKGRGISDSPDPYLDRWISRLLLDTDTRTAAASR